ncbi:MAG TPA: Ig-like domain-containing protein, partial [Thermoplasmata archaeon]|nr:Ig-like domain-containing protein [Thermoplasmata archaeon]
MRQKRRFLVASASLASLLMIVLPLPFSSSWPTGLVGPGDTCVSCHERGVFGVATTVARVNGIDPEWGENRGGEIAVGPGGTLEIEWRTTGFGYDYGETAGFIIVPNTTHWSVSPHVVADNGRSWKVPWTIASSDEDAAKKDNWRTWVTAYDHVHRAGDDDFPGWRGFGADKDDGSALDLNGIAHDEYLGARVQAPSSDGNHTLLVGASGMPEPLVNKGSWVEVKVRVAPLAPPRVTLTRPADATVDVSVLNPVELEFDRPMDRASTEAAFAMVPAAKGAFEWNSDRSRLGFVPETIFGFSTDYLVTLSPSARDRSGVPLGSGVTFGFTTQEKPPFTVYVSSPRGAERLAGGSVRSVEGAVLGGAPPYSVSLLLSTDSGASYPDEIAAFTMLEAGPFRRDWSVPALDSGTVRVAARV